MRYIQIYIIGVLIIIILAMYFFEGDKPDVVNINAKYDSVVRSHLVRASISSKHADSIRTKMKHDSIVSKMEKARYEKTISKLKRQLSEAKYTGAPASVPDDSVQLAMDCLEREPIRDSIDSVNYAHISQLEQEKAELRMKYESIIDDNHKEKEELQAVIDLKDKEISDLTKQLKKDNRNAKLRHIAEGAIGGFIIGSISGN